MRSNDEWGLIGGFPKRSNPQARNNGIEDHFVKQFNTVHIAIGLIHGSIRLSIIVVDEDHTLRTITKKDQNTQQRMKLRFLNHTTYIKIQPNLSKGSTLLGVPQK